MNLETRVRKLLEQNIEKFITAVKIQNNKMYSQVKKKRKRFTIKIL